MQFYTIYSIYSSQFDANENNFKVSPKLIIIIISTTVLGDSMNFFIH